MNVQPQPSADLLGRKLQAQIAVHLAPLPRIELACIAPCPLAGTGSLMSAGGFVPVPQQRARCADLLQLE